jgi:hypothetical protein
MLVGMRQKRYIGEKLFHAYLMLIFSSQQRALTHGSKAAMP